MPIETGHRILTDSDNIMIYRSRQNYAGCDGSWNTD